MGAKTIADVYQCGRTDEIIHTWLTMRRRRREAPEISETEMLIGMVCDLAEDRARLIRNCIHLVSYWPAGATTSEGELLLRDVEKARAAIPEKEWKAQVQGEFKLPEEPK